MIRKCLFAAQAGQLLGLSSLVVKEGFTMPEVFVAKGRDGVTDTWGTIFHPFNFNPKKKYPVIEYIYAGPHDSHVDRSFMAVLPRYFRLLPLGFIIVTIDGMGAERVTRQAFEFFYRNCR